MRIGFFGAADTVTGSRHVVEIGGERLLLDCGLFQGLKVHRERNWAEPPGALRDCSAAILSHAHLDHSGWLPVLVKRGWRGSVYASPGTIALARVLLLDSAHLQEEDARRANRSGYSRHARALPLYTRADARRALARLRPLEPGATMALGRVKLRLVPAGHLLGACAVHLSSRTESLLFSGDLGRDDDLLMPPPGPAPGADVLLVESTYGNRRHPAEDVVARLGAIVRDTVGRGGTVLLPSFAVGRAQALLLVLQRLRRSGQIPAKLPIFVDSPMALAATELYRRHAAELRPPRDELRHLSDGVRMVETAAQSMRLARTRMPAVIVSASGMATGGRVLHHLKAIAPDPRHHIVFPGFQVAGTRGAHLVAGATEVKIHGEWVPVRAQVSQLEGFSGHADADGVLGWLRRLRRPPRQVFVVHGEPEASDTFRLRVQDELGWPARVPQHGEWVEGVNDGDAGPWRAMAIEAPGRPLVELLRRGRPAPGPGQVCIEVACCGVCRTDLHLADGELPIADPPRVPGHEVVGRIAELGEGVPGLELGEGVPGLELGEGVPCRAPGEGADRLAVGRRVGVPWLGWTCGRCRFCRAGRENLCPEARFTGWQLDGGYARYLVADARCVLPIPERYTDDEAAPLLCAGLIGWRSYRMAGACRDLGLYGFGAAAHLVAQVARAQRRRVHAFTRPGDKAAQALARELGAVWAGGSDEPPPRPLDAALIFAPVGDLVPVALQAVRPGGTVVCGGIHMSDIPRFPYRWLWGERRLLSVANLTRADGLAFMRVAARVPLFVHTTRYALADANRALDDLRAGRIAGAAVLAAGAA